jgi:hypothetical protein
MSPLSISHFGKLYSAPQGEKPVIVSKKIPPKSFPE